MQNKEKLVDTFHGEKFLTKKLTDYIQTEVGKYYVKWDLTWDF